MPRTLAFILVLLTWASFHVWVARRQIKQGREYPAWAKRLIAALVGVVFLLPFFALSARRLDLPGAGSGLLQWLGFVTMGIGTLLVAFTIAVDVPRLFAQAGLAIRKRWHARTRGKEAASEAPSSTERRRFFADVANYGIVGGAVGLSAIGFAEARRVPRVVEVDVPVANLHPDLDGLRIVQLTDVHVGPTIRGTWLDQVVEVVNGLDADLVALTGDFIDGFVDDLGHELAALGRIESRHGAYFVTGNHEYYWDGPAWCEAIAALGPRVLVNEHLVIERGGAKLLVAGVPDIHADRHVPEHRSDPRMAKAEAPEHDFSLLLAHQPRSIYAASEAGFDLQLSGHTHAGQYFPGNLLIHLAQPYVSGLADHEGTKIYVSKGTGYWGPPNRAGSPSEVTLLTLRSLS